MVVGCPGCGKQHNVAENMAGRRAKCSCGTVIQIPQALAPAQPSAPVQPDPMPAQPNPAPAQDPLFNQQFPTESDPFAQQQPFAQQADPSSQQPAAPFQQPQVQQAQPGQSPNQFAQPFGTPGSAGPVPNQMAPSQMAPMPGQPGAMHGQMAPTEPVVCQFRYGKPQPWFLACVIIAGIAGIWMIYAGFFDNKGWAINNAPMPPWAATLFFECFGWIALGAFCFVIGGYLFQLNHPHHVAITQTSLLIPKGTFTHEVLRLPLQQVSVKTAGEGMATQLHVKHPGGTIQLRSALFPSSNDFDHFLAQLQQRVPTS